MIRIKLLEAFYKAWIVAESSHGCYSCGTLHDCRCPVERSKHGVPSKCECGRNELMELSLLIDMETLKSNSSLPEGECRPQNSVPTS